MSELVLLHHNEPMTTSLAIAEGTENTHESVIKLVRKYVEDLQNFGILGFEIQKSGGRPTEIAYLNEPQATLLITYMRNTEIVRRFKIALVKAFFELRDRAKLAAPTFTTNNLSHGADLAVAADRTFRGFLRSARSAGLRLPQALQVANRQTLARTGMDMLGELGVVVEDKQTYADDVDNVQQFMDAWREGLTRYPFAPCVAGDLLAAYEQWCAQTGEEAQPYVYFNRRAFSLPWLTRIQTHIDGKNLRIVMSREFIKPPHELKLHWYSRSVAAFRAAME